MVILTVMLKLYCPILMSIPPVIYGLYVSSKIVTIANVYKILEWLRQNGMG